MTNVDFYVDVKLDDKKGNRVGRKLSEESMSLRTRNSAIWMQICILDGAVFFAVGHKVRERENFLWMR